MGTKWAPNKLANHKGMLGKTHGERARASISAAQKGRVHLPQEGFQVGHTALPGTEATRFQKGRISERKGTGVGEDRAKRKLSTYRANAKRQGRIFEIDAEFMREALAAPCAYCHGVSSGLDRVDNAVGYVSPNLVPCCEVCNHMKWNLTREEFIGRCRKIVTAVGFEI